MDIHILLLLTVVGIIFVTVGFLGLYIDVNRRIKALKKSLRSTDRLVLHNEKRISVIEQRDRDQSNHVYFATDNEIDEERPNYSNIKYGGEGI